MKLGYTWTDVNAPYGLTKPQLGYDAEQTVGADIIYKTKREAIKDAKEYASATDFDWTPKLRVFKITAERVK